jgi:tetratricopeptide (TPR) repeat protein
VLSLAALPRLGSAQVAPATQSGTPEIHKAFPFQSFWDEALRRAQTSRKPVLVFDLDLIDSASIRVAYQVLENKALRDLASTRFEPALNDFAIDPPLTVGLDSLRNLGQRMSGLEREYRIGTRPTLIVLAPDSTEIDRIVFADNYSADQLAERLTEIANGQNTLADMIRAYWRDTTSVSAQQALVNKFEEHGLYDSVVAHLESLRRSPDATAAREASIRYALLRLQVEGNPEPVRDLIGTLGAHGDDSVLHYQALQQILQAFQKRKVIDSALAMYEEILKFTNVRDPGLLNDYAWYVAGYTKDQQKALSLITEALEKSPNDPYFLDTRALILGQLGRMDEAISTEERALKLAPADDLAAFKDSLQSLKDRKKAIQDAKSKPEKAVNAKAKVKSKN